ncbi:MAG: hypothetical protein ACFFDN_26705 [Candidatus Hodarchaeota archaeon]
MSKAPVKKSFNRTQNKKWVKLKPKELIEKYSDVLREFWHNGPVGHLLNKFYLNVNNGKIKIKRK